MTSIAITLPQDVQVIIHRDALQVNLPDLLLLLRPARRALAWHWRLKQWERRPKRRRSFICLLKMLTSESLNELLLLLLQNTDRDLFWFSSFGTSWTIA
ncbi:unnamed protein product [Somion occarium]|uniref:Uncharacterized protein n=1 Tax=Somion occarium TaxID=3059160 RepID=A0ABP1E9U7_9APHY